MKSYLAAAIQMTSKPDLSQNLVEAEELIDLAVRQGAELVGLPENFAFLGNFWQLLRSQDYFNANLDYD